MCDNDDSLLANFFSRPLKIAEFSWGVNGGMFQEFNPWRLYFENKRVINRISNYNLLRANLHVKFLINGNPFYYGRLIASYTPLHAIDNLTLNRAFFDQDLIAASQRPHLYLDPTTSQGGTMDLPFVWPYTACSIPLNEWDQLGSMNLRDLNFLQHANGGLDPITISVFAWASDVHLNIPTSLNPITMVPQSGDEYTTGPISTPAAVVAGAAGMLANMPYIGRYAMASQMVLNSVAAVAKMFGYSRPVQLEQAIPVRPTFGNYANTNVPDSSTKLAFDIKQEVTIDSSVVGLAGDDEMTIKSIATRESFLTKFAWFAPNPPETLMFTARVTPALWDTVGSEFHLTPMAFVSMPFKYWRGSIRFRFQVVASAYHRGRLKVVYDPQQLVSNEYNTNYTQIIDISTEKDFTVTIGWGNRAPFLTHASPNTVGYVPFSPLPLPGDVNNTNGVIGVYVVNALTEPNPTTGNDVQVNVFVSAGDDFEVVEAVEGQIETFTWKRPPDPLPIVQGPEITPQDLEPQSGEVVMPDDSRPMLEGDPHAIASDLNGTADIYKVMFGDPVASVRQVIKRFCLHSFEVSTAAATSSIASIYIQRPDFPWYRGVFTAGGIHASGLKNHARQTAINWFTPAFVCRRGGLRWKFTSHHDSALTGILSNFFMVRREANAVTYSRVASAILLATNDDMMSYVQNMPGTWSGGQLQSPLDNHTLEAEMPFFTNRRFWYGKNLSGASNNNTSYHTLGIGLSNTSRPIACAVAGADDYDLSFFTGCPILYIGGLVI